MSAMRRIIQPNTVKSSGVGDRQVLAIVSSEQRDRMGDVIKQDGIDYSDFLRGGGTVLWQHDANYPVARTLRLSVVNGCLTALTQFPPEGTSEKSDECYRLIREGVVNSTSIGFIPVEWTFLDKNRPGSGVLFREVQMLEFSYVSVPANPSALIIGKSLARSSDHGVADRIAIVAALRRGLDAHQPSGRLPTTMDYAGTAIARRALLWIEHPEVARDAAIAAADRGTREGRIAIARAYRRYHERTEH